MNSLHNYSKKAVRAADVAVFDPQYSKTKTKIKKKTKNPDKFRHQLLTSKEKYNSRASCRRVILRKKQVTLRQLKLSAHPWRERK